MNSDKVLRAYLKANHLPDGLRAVDEINTYWSRADVVTIGDELHGYEIKSSADSLNRLKQQVVDYDQFFNRNTLVTTSRHEKRALGMLPAHWGFILAQPSADGESVAAFDVIYEAEPNPHQDLKAMLSLTWCDELRAFLRSHNLRGCASKNQMMNRIIETFDNTIIKAFVCQTLLARPDWRIQEPVLEATP